VTDVPVIRLDFRAPLGRLMTRQAAPRSPCVLRAFFPTLNRTVRSATYVRRIRSPPARPPAAAAAVVVAVFIDGVLVELDEQDQLSGRQFPYGAPRRSALLTLNKIYNETKLSVNSSRTHTHVTHTHTHTCRPLEY